MSIDSSTEGKLWLIRKAGDIEYPIPVCGCKCLDCRKASHLYLREHALNEEYLRLLDQERKAMSETIVAVEKIEKKHTEEVSSLQELLDSSLVKSKLLSEALEMERKLRLSTVYDREADRNEAYGYKEENKRLTSLILEMQEDTSNLRGRSSELEAELLNNKTMRYKLEDQLKEYELKILRLEKSNTDLRARLTSR
jgi:hypothetical protein